jgi:diguanylate cyclase (GGDEF)-like protein
MRALSTFSKPPAPHGMAASDNDPSLHSSPAAEVECLSAAALSARMNEEISRARRHGMPLACLLVTIGNLEELSREHGPELPARTLAYVSRALLPQLRDFDRIGRPSDNELLVLLPGADGPRGEIVARRVLDRLRTIKIEAAGERRPLRISVGLAAWHENLSAEDLLAQTRAAAQRGFTGEPPAEATAVSPPALGRPGPAG